MPFDISIHSETNSKIAKEETLEIRFSDASAKLVSDKTSEYMEDLTGSQILMKLSFLG